MMIRSWISHKDFHFFFYDLSTEPKAELKAQLSTEEVKHLTSVKSLDRARTFLSSRARLRKHLAEFLITDPTSLKFSQNAQGKLFLSHPTSEITFSISHSGERLLICICTSGVSIGIDLETKKTDADLELIARGFFTDEEKNEIQNLSDEERRNRILEIWCLKEARFKMQGNSLTLSKSERYETQHLDENYVYALCYLDFAQSVSLLTSADL